MKASAERKIIRWIHIILSIPVTGYIYGPVAQLPGPAMIVRFVFFPIIILSGFYLWKGHLLKRWWRGKIKIGIKKNPLASSQQRKNETINTLNTREHN